MADNELERLISRYSQELMGYAKRSPSSSTENDIGDEIRRFDDGFNALNELRDRESGASADNDQAELKNLQAQNNADSDFSGDSQSPTESKPFYSVIMNGAFGEATDEDTPPPIILGDNRSQGDSVSQARGDSQSQGDSMSQTQGDSRSQSDSVSQTQGDNRSQGDSMSQFTGALEVTARTASDALPVEAALVIVTSPDGDGGRFEQVAMTDRSGLARVFNLPAANPENSQTPEGIDKYFLYSVKISKSGYYDMESRDIPLFGGVTSRQDFAMIPLPEGFPNETLENENTEPDNMR